MARKKVVIDERTKRTPEERKWVEEQLNKERTPEELKRAILGLGEQENPGAVWNVWFDKRIGAKLVTTGDEIYFKEAYEEGEYADSHFSELKRGFIDIIKQNPQDWEIKEYEVSGCMNKLPKGEWKPRDMVVTNWYKSKNEPCYCHYKNGFTEEEWKEIENALNYQENNNSDRNSIIKKIEELCAKLVQNYKNWYKEKDEWVKSNGGKNGFFAAGLKEQSNKIEEKYSRIKDDIYKEIKNQILKDLTLWELDIEGNIQPVPGVSVNTCGAGGGYILFGYKSGTSYIHFYNINYHREITRAFVDEIKKNPQDWEIIIEDERDVPPIEKPTAANKGGDHQVVKHKSGRRHKRGYQWYANKKGEVEGSGFSNEEWAEIENALSHHQKNDIKEVQEKKENKNNLTQKELDKKIQKLKSEIEESENNRNISSPERQIELKKKKEELAKLEELKANNTNQNPENNNPNSNNNFPTGWIVGSGILVAVGGLIAFLIIKKSKKKKKEKL